MIKKTNSILTISLAILIIFAVVVVVYINLPQATTKPEEKTVLTISYNNENFTYSLNDLKQMDTYTNSGRMIKLSMKPDIVITDSHNYTGVAMPTLLENIPITDTEYSISVLSYDGWRSNYSKENISGEVAIYSENGSIIPDATATMILTYAEDGKEYTNESDPGQLRISFVDNKVITSSKLWAKYVEKIEIISG